MTPLLVDVADAAELLGVGRRTVFALRARGDFPAPVVLASKIVRYRVSDLQAWLQQRPGEAKRPEPAHLAAGRARKQGAAGGAGGGTQTPTGANPRRARGSTSGPDFEPSGGPLLDPRTTGNPRAGA